MEKPILFNIKMVKAILDGRKAMTRRIIKQKYDNTHIEYRTDKYGTQLAEMQNDIEGETHGKNTDGSTWHKLLAYRPLKPPYQPGDILWVRETWKYYEKAVGYAENFQIEKFLAYKADQDNNNIQKSCEWFEGKWHPSIHMPREAARLFLRVKNVRVEMLQDITIEQIKREGIYDGSEIWLPDSQYIEGYSNRWNSCLKSAEIPLYGWNTNPWVWVIEFERVKGA